MGILEKVFGSKESGHSDFGWNIITTEDDVDDIMMASNDSAQVLFKHSTRCGTSFMSRKSLETFPDPESIQADFHMIDVIKNRSVSLYIAEKLQIRHESPQLFIIKDGSVIWNGSHHEVQVEILEKYLNS